jgi:hypothetical protein
MANVQSKIVFSSAAGEFLCHLEYIFDDAFVNDTITIII